MPAYYNEWDPFAAAWLTNLAAANKIAPGRVDVRSVKEVDAASIGDGQAHFFAGIGGWSLALRLAGWPDDVPVWTGSCPCQPFSQAGAGGGTDDDRHLWPDFLRLIQECRPPIVFGEQVASPAGLAWFDVVQSDMEGAGYACWAADLCAAGIGAPHLRQRLWFVGIREDLCPSGGLADDDDDDDARCREFWRKRLRPDGDASCRDDVDGRGADGDLAHAERVRLGEGRIDGAHGRATVEPDRRGADGLVADGLHCGRRPSLGDVHAGQPDADGSPCIALGDAGLDRDREHARELPGDEGQHEVGSSDGDHAPEPAGAAHDPGWIWCTDGKWRPTQPGLQPLAHGVPGRVGLLRGYGNAIVPPLAAVFIRAVMEYLCDL